MPEIVKTIKDMRANLVTWRSANETIALVPTMGALHEGHLSLVKAARAIADRTVVSIYINPTQFAPGEDLSRYPRDEAGDLAKLANVGADLVWMPSNEDMYPEGFSTEIKVAGPAEPLEGICRPIHFNGVATVVCKLLSAVSPDTAIFGEKDFQQLTVIRRMVRDLNIPVDIIGAPTVREADGLALSSRNAYLSEDEREIAPALFRAISDVANRVLTVEAAKNALLAAGFTKIDYLEIRDSDTLGPVTTKKKGKSRILAAAWLGKTRLIDNVPA